MHNIRKQFHSLRNITPDAEKKAVFRHALQNRVWADMHAHTSAHGLPASWTRVFRYMFHAPSFALAIVIAILGSTGGIAFASQNALPGDSLYGIKLKTERARLTIARDEKKKATLHIEYASRRMHEIEELINANATNANDAITTTVAYYEHELRESETLLEKNPRADTAAALIAATESHKDRLITLKKLIAERPHTDIGSHLEEAYEHAESHNDTALLTALSFAATSSDAMALPPEIIETSRKKVRSIEKEINEKKRSMEDERRKRSENDEGIMRAEAQLENAQAIIESAKTRIENEEYRESVRQTIEARTLIKEASSWSKEREDEERVSDRENDESRENEERDHDEDEREDDRR